MNSKKNSKIGDVDLYELLELRIGATAEDVRKAYRKKALKCHPDKNPDNPKAAELFHQLSEALEILLDDSARATYDRLLKAKEAAKIRHRELDAKRKKFKEDLEARERAHSANSTSQLSEEEKLQKEIERLRKEALSLVQQEIQLLNEQVNRDLNKTTSESLDGSNFRIKVQWKAEENDEMNGGYNDENLRMIFRKYGDLVALVVSKTKGKAMVEFETRAAAELAVKIEVGFTKNPLTLQWVDKNKKEGKKKTVQMDDSSLVNERDYESLVLRNMRQAEERRKLIEQMKNNDE